MLTLVFLLTVTNAQYVVEVLEPTPLGGQRPVVLCDATGANFGMNVMEFSFGLGSVGCAVPTSPDNACETVQTPTLKNSTFSCNSFFALVPRGNCSFSEKAYHVQQSSPIHYHALIVHNDPGIPPVPMSGSKFADLVEIPVVMVNYACMLSMEQYSAERGCVVKLKAAPGYYDLIKYLIPFVAVVSFCFIVLLISLVIRICRERRRLARKRLSRSNLKKLPTKKYKKGDYPETCAICLDDFIEDEKLRVLPCRHAYHCKCIDPWLTKTRKVCPVCKRKVGPSTGSDSSDSETERRRPTSSVNSPSTSTASYPENAPLISNEHPIAGTSQDSNVSTPEFSRRTDTIVVGSMTVLPNPSDNQRTRWGMDEHFQRMNRGDPANGSTEHLIENEFLENDDRESQSSNSNAQPSRFTSAIKNTFAPIFKVFSRAQPPQAHSIEEGEAEAVVEEPQPLRNAEQEREGSENHGFDLRNENAPTHFPGQETSVEAQVELHPPPRQQLSPEPTRRRRRHPAAQNKKPINPLTNTGLNLMEEEDEEDGGVSAGPEAEPVAQTYADAPDSSNTVKAKRKRPNELRRPKNIGAALATNTQSVPANMAVNTFKQKEGYTRPAIVNESESVSDPPSAAVSPQDLLAGPMDGDEMSHSLDDSYTGVVALNFQRH